MEEVAGGIRDQKPNHVKVEETHVTVKVQGDQPDITVVMRIPTNVPLQTLMLAYCDKVGLKYQFVRFSFDGKRVKDLETAKDLALHDGDVIDAWCDQKGGGTGAVGPCS